jgi:high-affinity iron transporter
LVEVTVFPAFLLALREGMEIALIIGIVLGALQKTNRKGQITVVWVGAAGAALLSLALALILTGLGASLEGRAEQIFEGVLMLTAAGVLTWMIFWMQSQARTLKTDLETGVRRAAGKSGRWALFSLAFLAVFREGLELALFLTASALASAPGPTLLGALLGLAAAALAGWALFAAILRLNLRQFFQVTSLLLILFAAGLVAHGVHELNEAGLVPALVEHVWDTNGLVHEDSTSGSILSTLFGYNGNPSLSEVLSYTTYLAVVLFALWRRNQATAVLQHAE